MKGARGRRRRWGGSAGPRVFCAASVCAQLLQPGWAPAADIQLRGLLDLTATSRSRAFQSNLFNAGDSNFDAYRLRLFAESPLAGGFSAYTQFLFDDAADVRALGAYVTYTPFPERDLHLQAGKLPWAVGTWGPRTYSDKNPLIGAPLLYQYHTTLRYDDFPPTVDSLLAQAGRGQLGVRYTARSYWRGMPVVYDLCWDFGVTLLGSAGSAEFALGAVNGTPARMNTVVDENHGKAFLGRVGWMPFPALRLGISGADGPYVPEDLQPSLPAGRKPTDYHQQLAMADLAVEFGHAELRAEGYRNRWQTPTVGDLDVRGYYVEGKYVLLAGLYAAARWEEMRFGEVTDSSGERRPWDQDVTRLEAGTGYRISKTALAKAVYQRDTWFEFEDGEREPYPHDLFALQLSLAF